MSQFNLSILGNAKGITPSHRKETPCHFYSFTVVYIDNGKIKTFADCRFYSPNGSTWYCCLWKGSQGGFRAGSGKAGGYGYHKPSAAFAQALFNCGISHSNSCLSGGGDSMVEECLIELAELFGIQGVTIIKSHP